MVSSDSIAAAQAEARQRVAMNVTELRIERGWSQAELAQRARVSQRTVEDIEAGAGEMRIDALSSLAQALRVPVARIVQPRPTKPH